MGFFRGVKKVAGSLVDVRADHWFSFDYVKNSTLSLKDSLSTIFLPIHPRYSETFEEAIERMHLSEEMVKKRQNEFLLLALFFILLAVALVVYGVYWAAQKGFSATLICFALCGFCLVQAFRFHFWYFQMKHRKLGCTLDEWINSRINPSEVSKE